MARQVEAGQGSPVTQIQLASQAKAFRGQPVQVQGWVRSARIMKVKKNELGIDTYYVLWMRPSDSNVAPYCVYAESVPEEFPDITAQDRELNEPVQVDGVFYKIRSYTASNEKVQTCPMILASSTTMV